MSLQAASLFALVSVTGAERSVRDLGRVSGAVTATQRGMDRMGRGFGEISSGLSRFAFVAAEAAVVLGVGAAKVGINFQDAFAGIKRSVEGTPAELDQVNEALKGLSMRIPVSYEDLAGIATEAGALGIRVKDIDAFTEAVARTAAAAVGLDMTTAADAFGKLGNLFHLTGPDYNRLASALVTLGTTGASSERDIIDVAERFAGAGRAAGLSAAQILGWSSALASLGPEAEAAGSSLVRMFGRVIQYAGTGDDKFAAFAKTAGLSEGAFKKLLGTDPNGAMLQFIGGLDELGKFDLAATLEKAGITNVRDVQAVQALAQNTTLLATAVDEAVASWIKANAVTTVSETRFDTLGSKVKILWSTIKVGAADAAEGFMPALDRITIGAQAFIVRHRADFVGLGKDIGSAIEAIDWSRVESGLERIASIAGSVVGFVKQLPSEILLTVGALAALSKAPGGGLVIKGTTDMFGGLLQAIAGRGSQANPMWVKSAGGLPVGPSADPVRVAGGIAAGMGGAALALLAGTVAAFAAGAIFALESKSPLMNRPGGHLGPGDLPANKGQITGLRYPLVPLTDRINAFGGAARGLPPGQHGGSNAYGPWTTYAAAIKSNTTALGRLTAATILNGRTPRELRAESEKARGSQSRIGSLRTGSPKADLPTVDYLARMFSVSQAPFYNDMSNARRALQAMKTAQAHAFATGDTKTAGKIGERIRTMQGVIAGSLGKVKTAIDTEKRATVGALRGKELDDRVPPIKIYPQPIKIYLDGRTILSSTLRYGPGRRPS